MAQFPEDATTGLSSLFFYDHNDNLKSSGSAVYSPRSDHDRYFFNGQYNAGTIDVDNGRDLAENKVSIPVGDGATEALVFLTYRQGVEMAIFGDSFVDPGQMGTLLGEYYRSDFSPPVTYQWYAGGSLLSGETGSSLQIQGGEPSTSISYQFRVTDATGRTISANHDVHTMTGCAPQPQCD